MPYIVYMLENGDFVTYEHLQPKKLYYVFISES